MSSVTSGGPGGESWGTAFGLRVRADWPLPELPAVEPGAAELEFVQRAVPDALPDAVERGIRYDAAPGRLLLRVDEVARFLAVEGRRIEVQPVPGVEASDVRAFLLTVPLGAVLQQRGDLVLHGSAVLVEGEAVVFLGRSGMGKSTLAGALARRGFPVLSDDLSVLRPGPDGRFWVQPGIPHLKLWRDSLEALAIDETGLARVRPSIEKRLFPLGERFCRAAKPLRRVFVLNATTLAEPKLEQLRPEVRVKVFGNQAYRFGFLAGAEEKAAFFKKTLALAAQVPVQALLRGRAGFNVEALADLAEGAWRT